MHPQDQLLKTSRLVIRLAAIANRLFLLAVCAGLAVSLIFPAAFTRLLIQSAPLDDHTSETTGLRLLLLIGIVMAVATDRLLAACRALITTAQAGDPFVSANARRLQTIGWSLLVLQLLDIAAVFLARFFPSLGTAAPDGQISVGGWMAVLMVFVLSRIFAAGAVMRDELEATV